MVSSAVGDEPELRTFKGYFDETVIICTAYSYWKRKGSIYYISGGQDGAAYERCRCV